MSTLLFVVYAAGIPIPDFCGLLSLLNAKRGQLNSCFWSALLYGVVEGSFRKNPKIFFFTELKINFC